MNSVVRKMTIQRGQHGLGFILSSQGPCIVSSVNQNGPADKAGLKTGDEILEVNSVDVSDLKHEEVIQTILHYKSQYFEFKVKTFFNEIDELNSSNASRKNSLFDNISRVVKGVRRTSLMFGSPPAAKKFNKSDEEIDVFQNLFNITSETKPVQKPRQIDNLSHRRVIRGSDYDLQERTNECESIHTSEESLNRSSMTLMDNSSTQALNLSNLFGIKDLENSLGETVLCSNLTPVKSEGSSFNSVYNAIVYYQCTVEMPKVTNLPTASLNTLNSCVYKIQRSSKSTRSLILLSISASGVKLSNPMGKEIVTYPLRTLVFSGICSEDRQYFGLVTRKVLSDQSPALSSSNSQHSLKAKNVILSSCHVFMIDLNLVKHKAHIETAALFHISCTSEPNVEGCIEFPSSGSFILQKLNLFYENRQRDSRNSSVSSLGLFTTSSTPDKTIISNTLERLRGNSFNQTPKDTKKLMINPPSSLAGLNDDEKEEIIREVTTQLVDVDENSISREYYQFPGRSGRRKSAPDTEACASVARSHSLHNGNLLASSLRSDQRKPPLAPSRNSSIPRNLSEMTSKNGSTFFTGIKRTFGRRRSEGVVSPNQNIKDFLKGNKKKETPSSTLRYEQRKDTNENVKRLSLTSASSEISLNEPTTRVEGWARSFERLLSDAVGVRCFQEFLKKEFSEENVLFWISCERFKLTKDLEKMKILANDIYRNYLSPKAPYLVNVNQAAVKKAQENLNTPHSDMFTIPQEQVFHLMKFDSYNRFLKSELYQECLQAETEDRLFPFEDEIDEELRKKPAWVKKGKTSANDNDKKKNLLNFLDRSSSLGTVEEAFRRNGLLSPDNNGHTSKDAQLWDGLHSQSKSSFLRVILPDGTSTMVVAENGQTIKQSLQDICEQKKIALQTFDVTVGFEKHIAHLDSSISSLQDNVIFLERRVLFRFDLPNGRSVGIKANPSKTLRDVLHPVMKKNGFNLDYYNVHVMNSKTNLSLDLPISGVENKRIVTKLSHKKLEKQNSDAASKPPMPDLRASFRRLRTNSFKENEKHKGDRRGSLDRVDRDKLTHKKAEELKSEEKLSRKFSNEMKHLILGRTRSADDDGASALMSVLQKSQSGRLDDQRGMITRDIELPEFLKVTNFSTPSPVRSKPITSVATHSSSAQSSPSRGASHYPATPVVIDENVGHFCSGDPILRKSDLSLSLSLNSSLNSGRPSLCSVRSWKELSSPDRELIDKTFLSGENVNGACSNENNKGTLLELSRSDPALIKQHIKKRVCKENSAPPFSPFPFTPASNKDPDVLDVDLLSPGSYTSTPNKFPTSDLIPWTYRDRARSFDECELKGGDKQQSIYNTLPSNKRLPISTFNENDVLRGLEVAGYEVIQEPENENTLTSEASTPSTLDTSRVQPNGKIPSLSKFTAPKPTGISETRNDLRENDNGLRLDIHKNKTIDRLGSVDILEYDLSPRASEVHRLKDIFESTSSSVSHDNVFKSNVIPTPEKGKLLKGETIRGRQNEKITFV
ncbi:regulator of G-protein signaling 12-like isoform X2 [Hydractinia symbiolongicarpus]|uniref:regulator of G-protein signaling 12-like isoform X2 n=1 Tax=Hydractinia symbiolongicarpus TaxID=13093 RepID=UPI00254E880D|nr:regulator of G-protein signaling 12-like isoform X2 [Hydractinia symbiolongicarpus]